MRIKIKFDPRDIWIGLYWNHRYEYNFEFQCNYIDYYICLIPCFPIHIHYDIHAKQFLKCSECNQRATNNIIYHDVECSKFYER